MQEEVQPQELCPTEHASVHCTDLSSQALDQPVGFGDRLPEQRRFLARLRADLRAFACGTGIVALLEVNACIGLQRPAGKPPIDLRQAMEQQPLVGGAVDRVFEHEGNSSCEAGAQREFALATLLVNLDEPFAQSWLPGSPRQDEECVGRNAKAL